MKQRKAGQFWNTHVVLRNIRMAVLDTVIKDRDDNAFASVASSPRWRHVHVEAPDGAFLQVPLLVVQRIGEQAVKDRDRRGRDVGLVLKLIIQGLLS